MAFPRARLAIFIDGCFWHGCAQHWHLPAKNRPYWERKIEVVRDRDAQDVLTLVEGGWRVIRLWEHDVMENPEKSACEVEQLLGQPPGDQSKP